MKSGLIRDILQEGAEDVGLLFSDGDIKSFELYAGELNKWNSRLNLTSITKESEITVKHFIDSLHMARHVSGEDILLDLGSGAGFPVIPLKVMKPETVMVSVDAVEKKIGFQRQIIRLLGLKKIDALHLRAENMSGIYAGSFSIITSRAFTRVDQFASFASPLLSEGGRVIAMKGGDVEGEIAEAEAGLKNSGLVVTELHRYTLPQGMGERSLVVMKKCESP